MKSFSRRWFFSRRSCAGVAPLLLGCLVIAGCRSTTEYPDTPPVNPEVPGGGGRGGAGGSRGAGGSGGGASAPQGTGGNVVPPITADAAGADVRMDASPGGMPDVTGSAPDTAPTAQGYTLGGVATWRGDASGAYTILFNSVCENAFAGSLREGATELTMRGLRGAFALIARSCDMGNRWDTLRAMVTNGHEMLNQSMSQPCLTTNNALAGNCPANAMRTNNYMSEIDASNGMIRDRTGAAPTVFSFPYDVCDPGALAHLKMRPFLGSRCGPGRANATDFGDAFTFKADFWGPGPSMYKDNACQGLPPNAQPNQASAMCRTHVLTAPLDEAINKKAWVVRGFHGFSTDSGNYQPITLADYRAHLDVVVEKSKSGQLWVATPSEVLRYRYARQDCAAPTITGNKLTFAPPSATCTKYATALTYIIKTSGADPAALSITQGTQKLAAKKTAPNTFLVEADPTKGDALLE
ncbi:MAG TPA: polysaccharide deacetylase family protein [Polyangia bacterium]